MKLMIAAILVFLLRVGFCSHHDSVCTTIGPGQVDGNLGPEACVEIEGDKVTYTSVKLSFSQFAPLNDQDCIEVYSIQGSILLNRYCGPQNIPDFVSGPGGGFRVVYTSNESVLQLLFNRPGRIPLDAYKADNDGPTVSSVDKISSSTSTPMPAISTTTAPPTSSTSPPISSSTTSSTSPPIMTAWKATFKRFSVWNEQCFCPQLFYKFGDVDLPPSPLALPSKQCDIRCFYALLPASPNTSTLLQLVVNAINVDGGYIRVTAFNQGYNVTDNLLMLDVYEGSLMEKVFNISSSVAYPNLLVEVGRNSTVVNQEMLITAQLIECICGGEFVEPGSTALDTETYCETTSTCIYRIQAAPIYDTVQFTIHELESVADLQGGKPMCFYSKDDKFGWCLPFLSDPPLPYTLTIPAGHVNVIVHKHFQGRYNISWTFYTMDDADCQCPINFNSFVSFQNDTCGSLSSPGYDQEKYCGPLDCLYYLPSPGNNFAWSAKVENNLLNATDFLTVYGHTKPHELQKFPKQAEPLLVVNSNYTTSPNSVSGFIADHVLVHWHVQGNTVSQIGGWTLQYQWTSVCFCPYPTLLVMNVTQSIMSPGYPDGYCGDMSCYWKLIADESSLIEVTVQNVLITDESTLVFYGLGFDDVRTINFDRTTTRSMRRFYSASNSLKLFWDTRRGAPIGGFMVKYRAVSSVDGNSMGDQQCPPLL